MIKAICFDLDGTLVDATELHYQALNSALEQNNKPIITRETHTATFDGLPTKRKLESLGYNKEEIEKINTSKQQITIKLISQHIKPSPQLITILCSLYTLYPLAVVSNSITNTITEMLKANNTSEFFAFTISNEDVLNSKPAPDMYLCAAKQFKLLPEQLLVIEDNKNGRKAALAAGCNLMPIKNPADVTLDSILSYIKEYDKAHLVRRSYYV